MRVEYINPFVAATFEILKTVANVTPKKGKVILKNEPVPSYGVSVLVGVVGEVKGQIAYSLSEEAAMKIASAMMMGMPVEEFDEMAKSAISELANMITGNASTQISAQGLVVDISPPTLVTGSNVHISTGNMQTIVIPVETELGIFEINIALE
ncbi:chemotaxis protein CheX [Haliovirga abyssi]|uniref:Chemotaxis protein CheX n=1 Tax=Haliovirga abyssi TaxID=2996794 RepID=A0AAU9DD10_9FUSO|nr:chemotaxis protein CheX [Haliovirga abyssi]BDU50048.1 chemotaxis protein CheX [Haliovirga abyssi]